MGDVDIDVGLYPETFIRLADQQTGATVVAGLDRDALLALVTQLMRGFAFLPTLDSTENPLFSIVDPKIATGRSEEGSVVLTIRPAEMPPFEITLAPIAAAALSDALAEHAY